MKLLDQITELVAGRVTVEKHELRALIRYHEKKGTEQELKRLAAGPVREPRLTSSNSQSLVLSRSSSSSSGIETSSPFASSASTYQRPQLQRSQSDAPAPDAYYSASGAPDLSARDLNKEELRRNYSTNNVWDRSYQDEVPLFPCVGLGKHRMSVHADPEWQMRHLQKNLSDVSAEVAESVAGFSMYEGPNSQVWQKFVQELSDRQEILASAASSASTEVNSKTGTCVTRGFSPSLSSSSTCGSPRDSRSSTRKDSGFSMSSPSSDYGNESRSPRLYRHQSRGRDPILSPLRTIRELQGVNTQFIGKLERPCDFGDKGDPDSAIASDDEEEENTGSWTDLPSVQHHGRRTSELTRMFAERGHHPLASRHANMRPQMVRTRTNPDVPTKISIANQAGLGRNKTIRAVRPQFRRVYSRGNPTKLQSGDDNDGDYAVFTVDGENPKRRDRPSTTLRICENAE